MALIDTFDLRSAYTNFADSLEHLRDALLKKDILRLYEAIARTRMKLLKLEDGVRQKRYSYDKRIPSVLLSHILGYSTYRDRTRAKRVCSVWCEVSNSVKDRLCKGMELVPNMLVSPQTWTPFAMTSFRDNLFVSCYRSEKIFVLNMAGTVKQSFSPGTEVWEMGCDHKGLLYIPGNDIIRVFTDKGEQVREILVAISCGCGRDVFAVSGQFFSISQARDMSIFSLEGGEVARLKNCHGEITSSENEIFIADSTNWKIRVISLTGIPLREWSCEISYAVTLVETSLVVITKKFIRVFSKTGEYLFAIPMVPISTGDRFHICHRHLWISGNSKLCNYEIT